jgi:hypothetical protein
MMIPSSFLTPGKVLLVRSGFQSPLNYAPKLGNREESEAAKNEGNAMEFR